MIYRLFAVSSLIILSQMFSCSTPGFLRNEGFIRDIFYPEVYTRHGFGENTPGSSFEHTSYDIVLKRYIDIDGLVDYSSLSENSAELDKYINRIAIADLGKLSKYSRISVLLNSYNAFTLKLITEYPGINSIKDIPKEKRWRHKRWLLGGKTVSLDQLEHEIIRKRYGDARIHFALVCAAKSCPELRNEPYTEEKLMAQLNEQAREFFNKKDNFRWDKENNTVYLSEILDWFRNDFAEDEDGVLNYISKYLDEATRIDITESENVRIKYIPYDWSLNGKWK